MKYCSKVKVWNLTSKGTQSVEECHFIWISLMNNNASKAFHYLWTRVKQGTLSCTKKDLSLMACNMRW